MATPPYFKPVAGGLQAPTPSIDPEFADFRERFWEEAQRTYGPSQPQPPQPEEPGFVDRILGRSPQVPGAPPAETEPITPGSLASAAISGAAGTLDWWSNVVGAGFRRLGVPEEGILGVPLTTGFFKKGAEYYAPEKAPTLAHQVAAGLGGAIPELPAFGAATRAGGAAVRGFFAPRAKAIQGLMEAGKLTTQQGAKQLRNWQTLEHAAGSALGFGGFGAAKETVGGGTLGQVVGHGLSGAAAGAAFGGLSRFPWAVRPAGAAAIGGAQAAAEGGGPQEIAQSAITLGIMDLLGLPAARQRAAAYKAELQKPANFYQGRKFVLQKLEQLDRARREDTLPSVDAEILKLMDLPTERRTQAYEALKRQIPPALRPEAERTFERIRDLPQEGDLSPVRKAMLWRRFTEFAEQSEGTSIRQKANRGLSLMADYFRDIPLTPREVLWAERVLAGHYVGTGGWSTRDVAPPWAQERRAAPTGPLMLPPASGALARIPRPVRDQIVKLRGAGLSADAIRRQLDFEITPEVNAAIEQVTRVPGGAGPSTPSSTEPPPPTEGPPPPAPQGQSLPELPRAEAPIPAEAAAPLREVPTEPKPPIPETQKSDAQTLTDTPAMVRQRLLAETREIEASDWYQGQPPDSPERNALALYRSVLEQASTPDEMLRQRTAFGVEQTLAGIRESAAETERAKARAESDQLAVAQVPGPHAMVRFYVDADRAQEPGLLAIFRDERLALEDAKRRDDRLPGQPRIVPVDVDAQLLLHYGIQPDAQFAMLSLLGHPALYPVVREAALSRPPLTPAQQAATPAPVDIPVKPAPEPAAPSRGADDVLVAPRSLEEFGRQVAEAWKIPSEQVDAALALVRARAWKLGMDPDEFVRRRFAGVTMGGEYDAAALFQMGPSMAAKLGVNYEALRRFVEREYGPDFGEDMVATAEASLAAWLNLARRLYGKSPIQQNRKTILSIDISTRCPFAVSAKGPCVYCYVEHSRFAPGMMYPKGEFEATVYEGELARMEPWLVKFFNSMGGLRVHSSGDYRPEYDALYRRLFADAKRSGLQLKVFTKDPAMVRRFAKESSANWQLSVDMDPDFFGALAGQDPALRRFLETSRGLLSNAMTLQEAVALKRLVPRAAIRYTALNRAEAILAAMDPRVDVLSRYKGARDEDLIDIWTRQIPRGRLPMPMMRRLAEAMTGRSEFTTVTQGELDRLFEGRVQREDFLREAQRKMCGVGKRCGLCTVACGLTDRSEAARVLGQILNGEPIAAVEFQADSRAVLRGLASPNLTSLVHEIGHVFRRTLTPEELGTAERILGVKDGTWTRANEERFAKEFERYITRGEAPVPALRAVFEQLREWLRHLYEGIVGSPLEKRLSNGLKPFFDSLLASEPPEHLRPPAAEARPQGPPVPEVDPAALSIAAEIASSAREEPVNYQALNVIRAAQAAMRRSFRGGPEAVEANRIKDFRRRLKDYVSLPPEKFEGKEGAALFADIARRLFEALKGQPQVQAVEAPGEALVRPQRVEEPEGSRGPQGVQALGQGPGSPVYRVLPDGTRLQGVWAWVPVESLISSWTKNWRINSLYPKELQNRMLTPEVREWVEQRVGEVNPDLLFTDPLISNGAPTVTPKNEVLAGNNRVQIAKLLASRNSIAFREKYMLPMWDKLVKAGLASQVEAVGPTPYMLVFRLSEGDPPGKYRSWADVAQAANRSSLQDYDPVNLARNDAMAIDADAFRALDVAPGEGGDEPGKFWARPENASIGAQVLRALSTEGDLRRYYKREVGILAEGVRRLNLMAVQKAYEPDAPVMELIAAGQMPPRILEGLLRSAPLILQAKARIAAGELPQDAIPAGLLRDITEAAALLSRGEVDLAALRAQEGLPGVGKLDPRVLDIASELRQAAGAGGSIQRVRSVIEGLLGERIQSPEDVRQGALFVSAPVETVPDLRAVIRDAPPEPRPISDWIAEADRLADASSVVGFRPALQRLQAQGIESLSRAEAARLLNLLDAPSTVEREFSRPPDRQFDADADPTLLRRTVALLELRGYTVRVRPHEADPGRVTLDAWTPMLGLDEDVGRIAWSAPDPLSGRAVTLATARLQTRFDQAGTPLTYVADWLRPEGASSAEPIVAAVLDQWPMLALRRVVNRSALLGNEAVVWPRAREVARQTGASIPIAGARYDRDARTLELLGRDGEPFARLNDIAPEDVGQILETDAPLQDPATSPTQRLIAQSATPTVVLPAGAAVDPALWRVYEQQMPEAARALAAEVQGIQYGRTAIEGVPEQKVAVHKLTLPPSYAARLGRSGFLVRQDSLGGPADSPAQDFRRHLAAAGLDYDLGEQAAARMEETQDPLRAKWISADGRILGPTEDLVRQIRVRSGFRASIEHNATLEGLLPEADPLLRKYIFQARTGWARISPGGIAFSTLPTRAQLLAIDRALGLMRSTPLYDPRENPGRPVRFSLELTDPRNPGLLIYREEIGVRPTLGQLESALERFAEAMRAQGVTEGFGIGFNQVPPSSVALSGRASNVDIRVVDVPQSLEFFGETAKRLPAGVKELTRIVNEEYRNRGTAELIGKTLDTPDEIAAYGRLFRDTVEGLRLVALRGNTVIETRYISSRLPNSSATFIGGHESFALYSRLQSGQISLDEYNRRMDAIFLRRLYELRDWMQRAGADGYFLVHNHPFSKAVPSSADLGTTARFAKLLPGFKAHLIVNHGSYTIIRTHLNVLGELDTMHYEVPAAVDPPLREYTQTGDFYGMYPVDSVVDFIAMAARIARGPDAAMLFFWGARHRILAVQEWPLAFLRKVERATPRLLEAMSEIGAHGVDMYFSPPSRPGMTPREQVAPFMPYVRNGIVRFMVSGRGVAVQAESPPLQMLSPQFHQFVTPVERTERRRPLTEAERKNAERRAAGAFARAEVRTRRLGNGRLDGIGDVVDGRILTNVPIAMTEAATSLLRGGSIPMVLGPVGRGLYASSAAGIQAEIEGTFFNWDALSPLGASRLREEAGRWFIDNEVLTREGRLTERGKLEAKAVGGERFLVNAYLRALGFQGSLSSTRGLADPQLLIWDAAAVRRIGEWQNPRRAPTAATDPIPGPANGRVRLYLARGSDDSVQWTPYRALATPSDEGIVAYLDVPRAVYDEARRGVQHQGFLRIPDTTLLPYMMVPDRYDQAGLRLIARETLGPRNWDVEQVWEDFRHFRASLGETIVRLREAHGRFADQVEASVPGFEGAVLQRSEGEFARIVRGREAPYRLEIIRSDGPSEGGEYATGREAVRAAAAMGFDVQADPHRLAEIEGSPEFQRGERGARIVAAIEELAETAPEAAAFLGAVPADRRAALVENPAVMGQLRRNEIPVAVRSEADFSLTPLVLRKPKPAKPVQQMSLFQMQAQMPGAERRLTGPPRQAESLGPLFERPAAEAEPLPFAPPEATAPAPPTPAPPTPTGPPPKPPAPTWTAFVQTYPQAPSGYAAYLRSDQGKTVKITATYRTAAEARQAADRVDLAQLAASYGSGEGRLTFENAIAAKRARTAEGLAPAERTPESVQERLGIRLPKINPAEYTTEQWELLLRQIGVPAGPAQSMADRLSMASYREQIGANLARDFPGLDPKLAAAIINLAGGGGTLVRDPSAMDAEEARRILDLERLNAQVRGPVRQLRLLNERERGRGPTPADVTASSTWASMAKAFYNEIAKRGVISMEGYLGSLAKKGDPVAMEFLRAIRLVQEESMLLSARWWDALHPVFKMYKQGLKPDRLWEIVNGRATADTPLERQAIEIIDRLRHPEWGEIPTLARFYDIRGYTGPGGRETPLRGFQARREYVPFIVLEKYRREIVRDGSPAQEEAIQHMLQNHYARTPAEARLKLAEQFGRTREQFSGHVHFAREFTLPEHMYLRDPVAAYKIAYAAFARELAHIRNLGKQHELVEGDPIKGTLGWIDRLALVHGTDVANVLRRMMTYAFGPYSDRNVLDRIASGAMAYQSMTKLPLSVIQNSFQHLLYGIEFDLRSYIQSLAERFGLRGAEGRAALRKAAEDIGIIQLQALRDMEAVVGLNKNPKLDWLASKLLFLWSKSELDLNQTVAARAAQLYFARINDKLAAGEPLSRNERSSLQRVQLDPDKLIERRGMNLDEQRWAAWSAVDQTQFFRRPSAMPGMFDPRGPLGLAGPVIFQWKQFAVRLNRTLWDNIVREARQGNFAPLAKMAIIAPIAGEMVALVRAGLYGRERRKWWEEDSVLNYVRHYFQNMLEPFGLGMAADTLRMLGNADWRAIAGPTVSQGVDFTNASWKLSDKLYEAIGGTPADWRRLDDAAKDAYRAALRELPYVGRPAASFAYFEEERLGQLMRDKAKASMRANEWFAKSVLDKDPAAWQKGLRALEDFNRKYQHWPGFTPLMPSQEGIREQVRRAQMTESEYKRAKMSPQYRPVQVAERMPGRPLLAAIGVLPPPVRPVASAAAAALAFGPASDRYRSFMGNLERQHGFVPKPPVTAMARAADAAAQVGMRERLAALDPERRRRVESMMAFLAGSASPGLA